MEIERLKRGMKLQLSFGIPPRLAKFHVSQSGKTIVCDTPGLRPTGFKICERNRATIEHMEDER